MPHTKIVAKSTLKGNGQFASAPPDTLLIPSSMFKYRPEIDGLRAVAVLPVILYHAGNSLFSGGFIGVDVFFTISGYLITSIILAEQNKNSFSLRSFYSRRAKRILPPLFLILLFVAVAACFAPGSDMALDSLRSISHIATFTSNIYFYKQGGYFETSTELKPLFHTWSLAVEEQFYVVFPLLLLFAKNWRASRLFALLFGALVTSLLYAQLNVHTFPDWTYYMLPTRAWELLAGALIAVILMKTNTPRLPALASDVTSFFGLLMILVSMAVITHNTPHPSFYTLAPIVGSLLIIATGHNSVQFQKIIGSRMAAGVGLISYSLYLWHQPLFALYKLHVQPTIPLWSQFFLIALSFVLAIATWKWVEQPTRHSKWSDSKILRTAFCASLLFFIIGRAGKATGGLDFLLTDETRALYAFRSYDRKPLYREGICFLEPHQSAKDFKAECLAPKSATGHTFIWGDSHAASLYHGLQAARPGQISQFTASNCPPVPNITVADRVHCQEINSHVFKIIESTHPQTVVLAANWRAYFERHDSVALSKTLEKLIELPHRPKILILGGLPQWEPSLIDVMATRQLPFKDGTYAPVLSLSSIRSTDSQLQSLVAHSPSIQLLSPSAIACTQDTCLAAVLDDHKLELMAWDSAHLTANGSLWWAQKILESQ